MTIRSEDELLAMRKIGKIVALARDEMLSRARAGVTTAELDDIGSRVLERYGAESAPRKTYAFPGATCISVNRVVAHGVPGNAPLKPGDVVNVDVSACLNGYYADTGATTVVGPSDSPLKRKLCECSRRALRAGIAKASAGSRLSGIGRAMQREAEAAGFAVIRNLTGHGIGRKLHEYPEHILGYYDPRDTRMLTSGLVLAVEPFVTTGAEFAEAGEDGWALVLPEGGFAAQFEHTIVVTKGEPIVLTTV